ncbi:RBBP9/YdeN family alpha/beta hydrolase [Massilia sp. CMS3.1]|uniref:RBBP9/YdeN family alpha/beta hydrolase n=1 Tax=Massilia sp. CMS3.1 TaxID=3373083 RepID=UPI003EE6E15E
MKKNTILLLPGLSNSGPEHWQTHWERECGYERVLQDDWDTPCVQDWVERLQARIVADDTPKILVAHSLACCLVAHWARAHRGPVAGSLLVAPSDVEGPNYPPGTVGFVPMPLSVLPFPTMVVASTDDEYVPLARGRHFAQAWGSDYRLIGPRGHIGSAAKLGTWQEGQALLAELQDARPRAGHTQTLR